jgi:hypothetical protein
VKRAEHRPVAAEDDDELGIVVDDLGSGIAGQRTDALDGVFETVPLAQQQADALDRFTRRLRR